MNGRVFLDTNVLVYLFDGGAPEKQGRAREVLEAEGIAGRAVISTQVLQEFYVSVTRKLGFPLTAKEGEEAARELTALNVVPMDTDLVLRAIARARVDQLSLWDALIVEAALAGGCTRLLTEDLQDGRRFGSLRVENPFVPPRPAS